jgi:hypothetical protein
MSITTMLQDKIAELEAYRAKLAAEQIGAPEFERPEQDSQAASYREGMRQSFEGIDNSLAYYRQQLKEAD